MNSGASSAASPPLPPPRVPDHELLRRIGRGAYGEVWLARSATGAYRAVKIVHRRSFDHDRPFEREFEGIRKFEPVSRTHDSQVDILHVGRSEDCFYYVMELADDQVTGGQINPDAYNPRTLKSDLLFHGRLPFEECVRIGLALATALEHLHTNGLVHRDVKPSNIIFVNGLPKLADIGLVTGVDATRSFVGTEGFAAPEAPGTPQADLYSLGKVLYEISTGKDRHEFPDLPTQLRELPDREGLMELNAVIARACRHDPKDRYPLATAMRTDLELLQSGKSLARLHRTEKRLRFVQRAGAMVTALAALIALGWLWQAKQTNVVRRLAQEKEQERNLAQQNLYAADMNLAYQALERGNLGHVRQLVRKYSVRSDTDSGTGRRSDPRGWEWRNLWQRSLGDETAILSGHSNLVVFAGMLADSRTVVSAGRDRTVRFWDLKTGQLLESVRSPDEPKCGALSPDARWLAVGGEHGCWSLWDTVSRELRFARTNSSWVTGVAFSADSARVAVASRHAVEVWNVQGFRLIAELARENFEFRIGLAFSPDGKTLAYSQRDQIIATNMLMLWDLETGTRTVLGSLQSLGGALGLAYNADGRVLICGDRSGISLWDISNRRVQKSLTNHAEQVVSVALSPNGKLMASASGDQTVRLWDTQSWEETRALRGHEHEVHSVTFSSDGKRLLSCGIDEAVRVWDIEAKSTRRETYTCPPGWLLLPGLPDTPRQLRIQIGTGSTTEIGFLDLTRCEEADTQPSPISLGPNEIPDDVSGDLSKLAILRTDGSIEIWSTSPFAKLKVIGPPPVAARRIALNSTGSWLAVEREGGEIEIRDLAKDRPCAILDPLPPSPYLDGPGRYNPHFSFWARDSRFVRVTGQPDEQTESIDILLFPEMVSKRITLTHKFSLNNFSLSSDGSLLATSAWDGQLKLWDIMTGKEIHTFTGQFVAYISLAFSPDGSRLAAGAWDGSVTLWDLSTLSQVAHWKAHAHYVVRVCFVEDGNTLMTRGSINTEFGNWETHIWRPPSFAEIEAAERPRPMVVP